VKQADKQFVAGRGLFEGTGHGDGLRLRRTIRGRGEPTLPSDWIADWRRMYDFSESPGGVRHPQLNVTRQIDSNLANGLQPECATSTWLASFRSMTPASARLMIVKAECLRSAGVISEVAKQAESCFGKPDP
jgi:hypothetical protein